MPRSKLIGVLLFARFVFGFQPDDALKQVSPVRAGTANPTPIYSPEPKYTDDARVAHISGSVLLRLVIDEQGRATQVEVLSPLGYGLDENSIEAVSQWRFRPATKDGTPVKTTANVQTTFHLGVSTDQQAEKQRIDFNDALQVVQEGKQDKTTINSLRGLASQKYPPGMYLYGKVLEEGRGVPANAEEGFRLIQQSADKKYGPALYEVAMERLQGNRLEKDQAKGIELMQNAAKFGSKPVREFLGEAYEKGVSVPADF